MPKTPASASPDDPGTSDLITIRINLQQFREWRTRWARRLAYGWRLLVGALVLLSAVLGILSYFK